MGALDQLFATEEAKATAAPSTPRQSNLDILFAAQEPKKPVEQAKPAAPGPIAPGPRLSLMPKTKEQIAPADPSRQVVPMSTMPEPKGAVEIAKNLLKKSVEVPVDILKRSAAVAVSQTADALKFGADYISKRPVNLQEAAAEKLRQAGGGNKVVDVVATALESIPRFDPLASVKRGVKTVGTEPFAKAQEKAQKLSQSVHTPNPEWEKLSWRDKITKKPLETVNQILPSVIGSFAPYLINPGLGFMSQVGATAEDVKQKAVKSGVGEKTAEEIGLATGLAVGVLDKIVPDKVVPGGAKKQFIGGFLKRMLKYSATEGATEVAQENIQLAAEATFRKDLGWDEVETRNAMALLGGLIGGSGINIVVGAIQKAGGYQGATASQEATQSDTTPPPPPAPTTAVSQEVFVERGGKMVPIEQAEQVKTPALDTVLETVAEPVKPAPSEAVAQQVEAKPELQVDEAADIEQEDETVTAEQLDDAQQDWEDNYADQVAEVEDAIADKREEANGAKGQQKQALLAEVKELQKQAVDIEQEWLQKHGMKKEKNESVPIPDAASKTLKSGQAKQGDTVQLVEIKNGKTVGVKSKKWKVADILKQRGKEKVMLTDAQGNELWTTPQSIVYAEAAEAKAVDTKPKVARQAAPAPVKLQDTPLHNRIMSELVDAEAGERIAAPSDGPGSPLKFTGKKSTFPNWIPKDLRKKPLLDAVSRHIMDGTTPTKAAEVRLYRIVADEMTAQDEVLNDAKYIETQRNNLFDPFATPEENAAALAKFDEEYAKLKGKPRSQEARRAEVRDVGEPVQAQAEVAAEPAPEVKRRQTAEEFVASKAAKFRTVTLKDNTGQFVNNQDYYAPRKQGLPALHYEDYAALTDFIDLADGLFRTDPRTEIQIEEDAARLMQDIYGKDVAGKSNEQLSRMAKEIVDSYETKDTRNAKFRLKEDLAAKGIEVTDAQEDAIIKLNRDIFGDGDIRIMGQILVNQEALGKYQRGIIEILGGQADPKATFYHEAVHKYLDVFTDRAEHIAILKEGQRKYGIDDFAEIEERIAEDFIVYAKSRTGVTGKLRLYFDRLIQRLTSFAGDRSKIEALYADIAAGKAKDKPQPSRRRPRNQKLESRVYSRLQAEVPGLDEDVTYQRQNLQENIDKAVDMVEEDPQQAYRVAMGVEAPPQGQTSTAVNIVMSERALEDGNRTLYAQLVKQRSIEQTRRGQEIVAEKGSVTDNSTARYVKELVKARMERLEKTTFARLSDMKLGGKKKSRAILAIDHQVDKAVEAMKSKKDLDIAEAQALIDSLACA